MALKPERQVHQTDMTHVLLQACEPGMVVAASGVNGYAIIAGSPEVGVSGVYPLGLVLNTRESFNYGKEYERFSYDTDDLGTVISICKEGELLTNKVVGTVVPGQRAYMALNGNVSAANPQAPANPNVHDFQVGRFLSSIDADGFVRVHVQVL